MNKTGSESFRTIKQLKFFFSKTLLWMDSDDSYHLESEFYYPGELENTVETDSAEKSKHGRRT